MAKLPAHPVVTPKPQTVEPTPPHIAANPPPPKIAKPVEAIKVEPEPVITAGAKSSAPPPEPVITSSPATRVKPAEKPEETSITASWLHSGVTPLPSGSDSSPNSNPSSLSRPRPVQPTAVSTPPPVTIPPSQAVPSIVPSFPRYHYLAPDKPKSGDRIKAASAFTQGRGFEDASRWPDAAKAYQMAAAIDPSWFEAQYNFGVIAARLRNFSPALAAYERALAIQPASVDARYNFAMTLKLAGYALDAVNELEKIAASNPSEARTHLALANLYAQQLHDIARARMHYLKVLELDPRNSQATNIRFWLSSNPG